jgi:cystinosin
VWNVVLDFAGAVLSLAQLVGDAVDLNDYSSITGNVAKLGLSIISIGFDVSYQEVPWFIL